MKVPGPGSKGGETCTLNDEQAGTATRKAIRDIIVFGMPILRGKEEEACFAGCAMSYSYLLS